VETEEQMHFLERRGCQYIQGYLTGKPMAANVAMAALKESIHVNVVPAELRQVFP
jgi:EAL domain-containing protein (putative c-di-GMP-specific phosphodiesterase class I)